VNRGQFNGKGGEKLEKFFNFCASDIWLNVRSENMVAVNFYERHGMEFMGNAKTGNGLDLSIYKKVYVNPFIKEHSNDI
jgi:ribosomal protein S18 acetylase RimI-like enzyme